MSRKTKSVKGDEVDFDLLETKQRIEQNKPRVLEVKQREDFVHKRRKSRGRSSVMDRIKRNKDSKEELKQSSSPKNENKTNKAETEQESSKKTTKRTIVKKGTSKTKKENE